jgi:hypothetical protein
MKTSFISNTQAINWPAPSSTDIAGPTELARISDRICVMLKEALGLSARLHGAADRAMGPIPTDCAEDCAKPQPASVVGQIDELLQGMNAALIRCIETADRIERLA